MSRAMKTYELWRKNPDKTNKRAATVRQQRKSTYDGKAEQACKTRPQRGALNIGIIDGKHCPAGHAGNKQGQSKQQADSATFFYNGHAVTFIRAHSAHMVPVRKLV